MTTTSDRGFLDRAVTVHRYDCAAVAEHGAGAADAAIDPAAFAGRPAEAAAYAAAARPLYDALRRIVGEASGLLILAAASGRREVADLPEIGGVRERWRAAVDGLADLRAPAPLERHRGRLAAAASELDGALAALGRIGSERETAITAATHGLKRAYRLLQDAADDRYGLAMVDFRQACCTCRPPAAA